MRLPPPDGELSNSSCPALATNAPPTEPFAKVAKLAVTDAFAIQNKFSVRLLWTYTFQEKKKSKPTEITFETAAHISPQLFKLE